MKVALGKQPCLILYQSGSSLTTIVRADAVVSLSISIYWKEETYAAYDDEKWGETWFAYKFECHHP